MASAFAFDRRRDTPQLLFAISLKRAIGSRNLARKPVVGPHASQQLQTALNERSGRGRDIPTSSEPCTRAPRKRRPGGIDEDQDATNRRSYPHNGRDTARDFYKRRVDRRRRSCGDGEFPSCSGRCCSGADQACAALGRIQRTHQRCRISRDSVPGQRLRDARGLSGRR